MPQAAAARRTRGKRVPGECRGRGGHAERPLRVVRGSRGGRCRSPTPQPPCRPTASTFKVIRGGRRARLAEERRCTTVAAALVWGRCRCCSTRWSRGRDPHCHGAADRLHRRPTVALSERCIGVRCPGSLAPHAARAVTDCLHHGSDPGPRLRRDRTGHAGPVQPRRCG